MSYRGKFPRYPRGGGMLVGDARREMPCSNHKVFNSRFMNLFYKAPEVAPGRVLRHSPDNCRISAALETPTGFGVRVKPFDAVEKYDSWLPLPRPR